MTLAVQAPTQCCTFWTGGLLFGVSVFNVQEVLRFQHMSPVPSAPDAVSGLINLRGQIVTAIDLRHRLGLPPQPEGATPINVVARSRGEIVSFLVDDIGDVIETGELPVQPPPANLSPTISDALLGVITLPQHILLVLDVDTAADITSVPQHGGSK